MKTVIRYSLFLLAMIAPAGEVYAHVDGAHSGGLMQSLLHIVQSPEHLTIMFVVAVVASFLVGAVIKKHLG